MDRNPFAYGRELAAEELVDRESELDTILRTIDNRGKLFLIGPRRYGKTSLLSAAGEIARSRGVVVLRFDAEKYETLELLARALLTGAARSLHGSLEKVGELVRGAAAALKPSLALGEDGALTVQFGVHPPPGGELPLLADALDSIDRLAERSGQQVAIVLDEVQQIVVEYGLTAEKQLRAAVQTHRNVAYVFAGSETRLLSEMTSHPDRPFYRLGARLFLGAVPRGDFLAALRNGFESGGFSASDDACRHILDLAEDVPHNVQRLAYEAWELCRVTPGTSLTPQGVDEALDRILRMEDPAYSQVWNGLTRNQKKTLKAVIETGGENVQSAAVSRAFGIATSSVQSALAQLEDREIVRGEAAAGRVCYRLVDPFLAAWLRLVQDT